MMHLTVTWWLAGAFAVADVALVVLAFRLGWFTLARRARRAWDDESRDDDATGAWLAELGGTEPETMPVPVVITDIRLAASLPRAMPLPESEPAYVPDPARVQVLRRWADPGREYLGEYREVWDERPGRLAAIDELVELLADRVWLLHDTKRGLVTEWEGKDVQPNGMVSE